MPLAWKCASNRPISRVAQRYVLDFRPFSMYPIELKTFLIQLSVSSPTPSSQTSITSSSTSTTPMVTSSPARGISKGAAAGIGLGSALGALLLVAVSAFAYRSWTTRRSDRQRPMADSTGDSKLPARAGELPASSQNVHELYAQHHSELHA
jgi:hypothetical protein